MSEGSERMSEKEKEKAKKISKTVEKLDPKNLSYVAGLADGMAIMKESMRPEVEEQHD